MATKRVELLIGLLKEVVEDDHASESDRESCLKKLFVQDVEYAREKLEKYVEQKRPWAISLALKIEKENDAVVGGVGFLIGGNNV